MGSSVDPEVFTKWSGWSDYFINIRRLPNYTLAYTGQRSVSPFATSTIIRTTTYNTAAGASCARGCAENAYCGAIEMFVERTPSVAPSANNSNPAPAYWVVCRLHSKQLNGTIDAKHIGRIDSDSKFNRTQTTVTFLNRKGWIKPQAGRSCGTGKVACQSGSVCDSKTSLCKLAAHSACAGSQDDANCVTGLCSFNRTSTSAVCLDRGKKSIIMDKHCLASDDCASGNCSASKRCGPPLTPACKKDSDCKNGQVCDTSSGTAVCKTKPACSKNADCPFGQVCDTETSATPSCRIPCFGEDCDAQQFCDYYQGVPLRGYCVPKKSNNESCAEDRECDSGLCDQSRNGVCAAKPVVPSKKANNENCSSNEECASNVCDQSSASMPATCGKPSGTACENDAECRFDTCDPSNKKCGRANGQSCSASFLCSSEICDSKLFKCGKPVSASCSVDSECSTGICGTSKTCAAPASSGQACTANSQCSSKTCDLTLSPSKCGNAIGSTCSQDADCSSTRCESTTKKCISTGTTANNGQCISGDECASGVCSRGENTQFSGCGKASGDACSSDAECRFSKCNAATKTCGLANGETCSASFICSSNRCDQTLFKCGNSVGTSCATHLDCSTGICGASKTCAAAAANGQTCTANSQCSSKACDLTLSPAKCGKTLGATCSQSSECSSTRCDPTTRACVALKANGVECSSGSGDECASGQCSAGSPSICGKSLAQACNASSECATGFCSQNTCQRAPDGQACKFNRQCAHDSCKQSDGTCYSRGFGEGCSADLQCASGVCNGLGGTCGFRLFR